jgi:hypothetical protein
MLSSLAGGGIIHIRGASGGERFGFSHAVTEFDRTIRQNSS